MRVFKRGKTYWLDYKAPSGERCRESTGTGNKKLADQIAAKREVEILEQTKMGITPIVPMKISELKKEYLALSEAGKAKKSFTIDRNTLDLFIEMIGDKFLHEVTEELIEKFKVERLRQVVKNTSREVSPGTVHREMATLKTFFKLALRRGKIRKDPCEYVKKPQEPPGRVRYLTKEELPRLLDACRRLDYLFLFVVIALNTGMRKSEITNLTWSDVDLDHKLFHLEQTKNRERADILINQVVIDELRKYRKKQERLCQEKGTEFPEKVFPCSNPRIAFENALKAAKIHNFHIHDLRHTFASYLVMNNIPLPVVKELMRHKSFDMTLRYAHLSPIQKQDAVDKMAEIWNNTPQKVGSKEPDEGRDKTNKKTLKTPGKRNSQKVKVETGEIGSPV